MLKLFRSFSFVSFALLFSLSSAQGIKIIPAYDTLAVYGPDYPPEFECMLMHPSSTVDRIAIVPRYTNGFWYNPPSPAAQIEVDTLYFEITDSIAFNAYELWYRHAPPSYLPANGQIPFDSVLPAMPGQFDITLKVRRSGAYADSAKQLFISYMVGAVDNNGPPQAIIPWLYQNYPNPFNPTTTVGYRIQRRAHVFIGIYNMLGQLVTTLVDQDKQAGDYTVPFDASQLSSGLYLCQLRTGTYKQTRKLLLLR
jgi:hypothetical protein